MAHYKVVRRRDLPNGFEAYKDGKLIEDAVFVHWISEFGKVDGRLKECVKLRIYRKVGNKYSMVELGEGDILETLIDRK